jgi:hypothetical protein
VAVVIVCGVLFALALLAAFVWRNEELIAPPAPDPDGPRLDRLRHHLWWMQLVLVTALLAGTLVMGVGGRLAMRLLGATGGDAAQGRLTEADQVVGRITVGGTIGFVFFIGVLSGLVTTIFWFATRRFLPAGWTGGLLFGAALLVVLGTRIDPLRAGNEDFDLVGPWWLSIVTFTALALAFGIALSSYSARISRWLPVLGRDRRSLSYVALLALVPLFPFGILAVVTGLLYVFGGPLLARVRSALTGPTGLRTTRLAIGFLVAAATPGFLLAIGDLVGRGP